MKTVLISMISMTALCLYSDTSEEMKQFIRETVEEVVQSDFPEHRERWYQMVPKLDAIAGDIRLSVYCEIMAEKFDDPNPKYVNHIMLMFFGLDGNNLGSYGNKDALDWTRRALRERGKGIDRGIPIRYLVLKGDERDLGIVSARREILAARVAGTNVVNHPYFNYMWHSPSVHLFSVVPSVTNVGPQALYVEAIIRQYWERLEIDDGVESWGHPFRDPAKIPADLLTMVVWFDEDGNPVCNVDLAKYGLTMPELDVPNKPKGKAPRPEPPTTAVTTNQPTIKNGQNETPTHRSTPYLLPCIAVTLALCAAFFFLRKKPAKR